MIYLVAPFFKYGKSGMEFILFLFSSDYLKIVKHSDMTARKIPCRYT